MIFQLSTLVIILSCSAVVAQNLTNPNYDDDLTGWVSSHAGRHTYSEVDWQGSMTSGSLLATKDYAASSLLTAYQCVTVTAGNELGVGAKVYIPVDLDPAVVCITLGYYSDTACADYLDFVRISPTPAQGQWVDIYAGPYTIPEGVHSAKVNLQLYEGSSSSVPVQAHFDGVYLVAPIFENGFESGDTTAWSTVAD